MPLTDRLRAHAAGVAGRFRALSHQTQVVSAVVAVLVVLLVVVALLGGGGSGGSGDQPPDNTPRNLRQPLQDLHDAVNGS